MRYVIPPVALRAASNNPRLLISVIIVYHSVFLHCFSGGVYPCFFNIFQNVSKVGRWQVAGHVTIHALSGSNCSTSLTTGPPSLYKVSALPVCILKNCSWRSIEVSNPLALLLSSISAGQNTPFYRAPDGHPKSSRS